MELSVTPVHVREILAWRDLYSFKTSEQRHTRHHPALGFDARRPRTPRRLPLQKAGFVPCGHILSSTVVAAGRN